MRRIYILLSGFLFIFGAYTAKGQSFKFQHDTVRLAYTGTGLQNLPDDVDNLSTVVADSVLLTWKVIDTDFPADWQSATGICDNKLCYNWPNLWPTVNKYSLPYPDGLGDFHLQTALTTTSPVFDAANGCHFVKVRAYNYYIPTDSATIVFIVCKGPILGAAPVVKPSEEILIYPNPASTELNVVFDAAKDIRNIVVSNIIGKVISVYKVSGANANLNIENLNSGIYVARMYNAQGNVVATRKFTKQ